MKIQKFESFDQSYQEMTIKEWNDAIWGNGDIDSEEETKIYVKNNWDEFNKVEIEEINQLGFIFKEDKKDALVWGCNNIKYNHGRCDYPVGPNDFSNRYNRIIAEINLYKLKDEWYYAYILEYRNSSDVLSSNWKILMYKCDQLEGLKDCLKMVKEHENINESKIEIPYTSGPICKLRSHNNNAYELLRKKYGYDAFDKRDQGVIEKTLVKNDSHDYFSRSPNIIGFPKIGVSYLNEDKKRMHLEVCKLGDYYYLVLIDNFPSWIRRPTRDELDKWAKNSISDAYLMESLEDLEFFLENISDYY